MRMRGSRYEVSSTGFDTSLQGVGADPDGSGYATGIRVPTLPSPPGLKNRYLFMLARMRLGAFRKARLVGIRQLVTIGTNVSNGGDPPRQYPLELGVNSPFWKFTDGNISWHLRRVPPIARIVPNNFNGEGLSYLDSQTPSLVYSTAPADVGGYVPPSKVYGVPLIAQLGTFYDLRFGWRDDHAVFSLDTEIQGPCDIALYASVRQTNPDTRATLVLPDGLTPATAGISKEDEFVANFPNAQYWRVAGSLVFQEEEFYGEPRGSLECWGDQAGPRAISRVK